MDNVRCIHNDIRRRLARLFLPLLFAGLSFAAVPYNDVRVDNGSGPVLDQMPDQCILYLSHARFDIGKLHVSSGSTINAIDDGGIRIFSECKPAASFPPVLCFRFLNKFSRYSTSTFT